MFLQKKILMVPREGIEPSLCTEHDFESCASTNSAISAFLNKKNNGIPAKNRT